MEKYEVYMHNVPKVSEDGKVIPIAPPQKEEFAKLEEAQKCASDNKGKFDRIIIIHTTDEGQKMVERYNDGEHVGGATD